MAALTLASGCATATRSGDLGVLPRGERLVTLIISEDPTVVRDECPLDFRHGTVVGCQTSREIDVGDGQTVRAVKIVRYTDLAPSALAFEIDIHELCHAIAALQAIADPCHDGNGGMAQHPMALRHNLLFVPTRPRVARRRVPTKERRT
jgi:hypothetical protein